MVIMNCWYKTKPGMVGKMAEEIIAENVQADFRKQPGNVCFNYSVAVGEEDLLYLVDVWESVEAFEAHAKCDVIPRWTALKEKYVIDSGFERYDA